MNFFKKLLGLDTEELPPAPQFQPETIPRANLQVERQLFHATTNYGKLQEQCKKLEAEHEQLAKTVRALTMENRVIEARKLIRELGEGRKKLDEAKEKARQERLHKTNLEIERMKLALEHEANKSEKFMTGMLDVNRRMKSFDPKEVQGSLERTNQLIKMLAGEGQKEELKKFYETIAAEEEEDKSDNKSLVHKTSYVDPNLSDDGMSVRKSSVRNSLIRQPNANTFGVASQQLYPSGREQLRPDSIISSLINNVQRPKGPASAELEFKDSKPVPDFKPIVSPSVKSMSPRQNYGWQRATELDKQKSSAD